ncbi:MAG TPA: class I adenylate-forming enzyme family protein [Pelomicrobium sp.]|nr:class I adenylate-forming enzyme family protein [Pelomicrobium sp.]
MSALAQAVRAGARDRPDAPALIQEARRWTYAELEERGVAAAAALAAMGARAGDTVALASSATPDLAAFAYACAFLDATFLPLNGAMPPARRETLVATSGARLVFGDDDLNPAPVTMAFTAGTPARPAPGPAADIEIIIATSGSSGEPKGVMLTAENLVAAARAAAARVPLGAGDTWLACLPLYHVGGLAILYRCALAGAAVLLHDGFDTAAVARDLARHWITHVSLVPPMLARLLDAGVVPHPRLRAAVVGGGELHAPLLRRALAAGWPAMPSYGMSETCAQVATLTNPGDDWAPGDCGRPLPGVQIEIVNPDDTGAGRIRVRGANVMAGYANPRHERGTGLTNGAFVTADIGRIGERGHVVVLGRADDMLVTGGINVHPTEVERLLADCPGVAAAGVTGRSHGVWGDLVVALYEGSAREADVEAWCRACVPNNLRPRAFLRVDALPRAGLANLDRAALRRLAASAG